MLKKVLFSGFVAFAGVSAAAAQEAPDDGVYLRAGAGVTFVEDFDQDVTFSPFLAFVAPPSTGQTLTTDAGFIASGAIGFDYADGIRTELEYRYDTVEIDTITRTGGFLDPTVISSPNDDINAQFILTNFYYDFRNASRLTPFIGLGVGGAFVENEFGDRDAALAYQGRAGVSLALNSGFSIDAEYIYLRTNDLVYGPADDEFELNGPGIRIDDDGYVSSSALVSLRKQF